MKIEFISKINIYLIVPIEISKLVASFNQPKSAKIMLKMDVDMKVVVTRRHI